MLQLLRLLVERLGGRLQLADEARQCEAAAVLAAHLVMLTPHHAVGAEEVDSPEEHLIATAAVDPVKGDDTLRHSRFVFVGSDLRRDVGQGHVHHSPCATPRHLPAHILALQFGWAEVISDTFIHTIVKVRMRCAAKRVSDDAQRVARHRVDDVLLIRHAGLFIGDAEVQIGGDESGGRAGCEVKHVSLSGCHAVGCVRVLLIQVKRQRLQGAAYYLHE